MLNLNANAQGHDKLKPFYIIDTIEVEVPKLIYIHKRVKSIDKFTVVIISETEFRKVKFNKIKSVEQLLAEHNCYIFQEYSSLISTLIFYGADTLNHKGISNLTADSCIDVNKKISGCNLRGLNQGKFIIALMNFEHYNYFKVIEHKKLNLKAKYVLVAYPFQ
jgi:hypothetical protein